ncbi:MAG: hypothetical protein AAFY15_12465, partial [Cyanobacteria bacterium J06648_11]
MSGDDEDIFNEARDFPSSISFSMHQNEDDRSESSPTSQISQVDRHQSNADSQEHGISYPELESERHSDKIR